MAPDGFVLVHEKSLEELTDIMSKAKDIAITQSSDFFNADVRKSVSNEVQQLYNQSLGVANKKIGVKNIFAGTNTLTVPFDANGNYKGDTGHINLEVSSSFFVPINLNGEEVFFNSADDESSENSLNSTDEIKTNKNGTLNRDLASKEANSIKDKNGKDFVVRDNIFSQLQALTSALENNDPEMIQGLLDKFDATISRLISLRTKVGSISSSVESSKVMIENENVDHISRKSTLIDADVAELFSDLNKQQAILKTTYQSTQGIINQSLMDFLRR